MIPCCLNHHWSLILAVEPQETLIIFSSMHNIIDEDDFQRFCLVRNHFNEITGKKWDLRIHTTLKPQCNSDDCGVFGKWWQFIYVCYILIKILKSGLIFVYKLLENFIFSIRSVGARTFFSKKLKKFEIIKKISKSWIRTLSHQIQNHVRMQFPLI